MFAKIIRKKSGFSMVELLTAASVVGVTSLIGINSYMSQTNKARAAEAKQILSYIYTAEQSFHKLWLAYHENLIVVGAVPSGSYNYDAGFSRDATLAEGGNLNRYSERSLLTDSSMKACINFHQICVGSCRTNILAKSNYFYFSGSPGNPYDTSKSTINCKVNSSEKLKDATKTKLGGKTYEAKTGEFKAVAIGQLKETDVWSIDESRVITHEVDGTE